MGPAARRPAGALVLAGLILPALTAGPIAATPYQGASASPAASATAPSPSSPTPTSLATATTMPSEPPSQPPPSESPSPTSPSARGTSPPPASPAPPSPTPSPPPTDPPSTPTGALTPTSLPTQTPPSRAPGAVLINEVAWAGSLASASDEWIELYNAGSQPIDLDGWQLTDGDDLLVDLSGAIPAAGYYLLERTDDSTVSSVPADLIYTGSLRNSGEALRLMAADGSLVDSANRSGGPWPAGDSAQRRSMERLDGPDAAGNWRTFAAAPFAYDADGNALLGSPKGPTLPAPSATPGPALPTSTPSPVPAGRLLINEVAWAGTNASAADEWIELFNPEEQSVPLDGWRLSDGNDLDVLLTGTLPPLGYYLLERTDDSTVSSVPADLLYRGSLSNAGEALVLISPQGRSIDSANSAGGPWPAGQVSPRRSMERAGPDDTAGAWRTFEGIPAAVDAAGDEILGSPRGPNSWRLPLPTATPTQTPTSTPTSLPAGTLLINEVAWAGNNASASDEWMELLNRGPGPLQLDGWILTDGNDIRIELKGTLAPGSFFLLERTDDDTIRDIAADQLYSGGLRNSGEVLRLIDPGGRVADQANGDGGKWPAGDAGRHASMERDSAGGPDPRWGTYTGYRGVGMTIRGGSIAGTPGQANSILFPTPTPTWIPGRLIINEVLVRPHYDWEGTGGVSTADEFIEIYNHGPGSVRLQGFMLDDEEDEGSRPFHLPGIRIAPKSYAVFFRSMTRIALNDGGDTVRLLDPKGRPLDEIQYLRVRAYNLSYGRLPDASNQLAYGLWPTPGEPNLLYVEPAPARRRAAHTCGPEQVLAARLPRLARRPAQRRWLFELGLALCLGPPSISTPP